MNWIIAFLTDHTQVCKATDGRFSAMHPITRSIIQEPGIGPTLWIVMASDLCCISDMNLLFKYADDTNLLVPENTNVDLEKMQKCIHVVLRLFKAWLEQM